MKTIERLNYPVHISRQDGCTRHDSAVIVLTNGAPAFVRASRPDVVYPWDNIRQIGKVVPADEVDTAVTAAEVERLQAEVDRLKQLHHDSCVSLRDALGLTHDNHAHAGLCEQVARIRAEWDHLRRYTSPGSLARLEHDLKESKAAADRGAAHHVETLAKMRGALSEALGHGSSPEVDFDDLCRAVAFLRKQWSAASTRAVDLAKSQEEDQRGIASLTEQRDVLKRQLEELRAGLRKPAATPRPSVPPPGFDINRLPKNLRMTVETAGVWGPNALFEAWRLHEEPGAEYQQTQNRDQWRATCLAYGAKDCTVYYGPGDEVTFVVELKHGASLDNIKDALCGTHGFNSTNCKIRKVRPIVDGVKPSTFKHPADNGQP